MLAAAITSGTACAKVGRGVGVVGSNWVRLGAGLCLATPDTRQWQRVVAGEQSTGVAVRLDEPSHRVALGLAFLEGRKVVDVSVDPASWVRCARQAARACYEPDGRWADALSVGLRRTGTDRGWWDALPQELAPELIATAAAWPLLRPSIAQGGVERVVPRWLRHCVLPSTWRPEPDRCSATGRSPGCPRDGGGAQGTGSLVADRVRFSCQPTR